MTNRTKSAKSSEVPANPGTKRTRSKRAHQNTVTFYVIDFVTNVLLIIGLSERKIVCGTVFTRDGLDFGQIAPKPAYGPYEKIINSRDNPYTPVVTMTAGSLPSTEPLPNEILGSFLAAAADIYRTTHPDHEVNIPFPPMLVPSDK